MIDGDQAKRMMEWERKTHLKRILTDKMPGMEIVQEALGTSRKWLKSLCLGIAVRCVEGVNIFLFTALPMPIRGSSLYLVNIAVSSGEMFVTTLHWR